MLKKIISEVNEIKTALTETVDKANAVLEVLQQAQNHIDRINGKAQEEKPPQKKKPGRPKKKMGRPKGKRNERFKNDRERKEYLMEYYTARGDTPEQATAKIQKLEKKYMTTKTPAIDKK